MKTSKTLVRTVEQEMDRWIGAVLYWSVVVKNELIVKEALQSAQAGETTTLVWLENNVVCSD